MKKIMIFDFDGTLGDSELLITNTMLETIEKMGLPQRFQRKSFSALDGLKDLHSLLLCA